MAYHVEITRKAETDLEELYLWVVERAPQQGAAWFNGLERAILTLDRHADRCPVASESVDPDRPVRVLTYGRKAACLSRLLHGRPHREARAHPACAERGPATTRSRRAARRVGRRILKQFERAWDGKRGRFLTGRFSPSGSSSTGHGATGQAKMGRVARAHSQPPTPQQPNGSIVSHITHASLLSGSSPPRGYGVSRLRRRLGFARAQAFRPRGVEGFARAIGEGRCPNASPSIRSLDDCSATR